MEFTDSQKKAVETRRRSLMVSAAAGSGKTATLTARIISLLTDDCIDYEVSENKAGKPVQSDFENGVMTMPFLHALAQDPSLVADAENGNLSKERVIEEVARHQGVSFTHKMAKSYYDRCCDILDELALTGKRKEVLTGILERAYRGLN